MDRFKQNMAGKTEGDDDIKSFLSKVDEIESIMKGLTSSEEEKQTVALKKADEYLSVHGDKADASIIHDKETGITTKIGFDGTQINKSCGPKKASDNVGAVSAEDFMKAVSDDAKARASERKQREAVALQLKEKGNLAFKQQKYEEAVKLYTQALNQDRTNTAFYTNRAQAYIRTKNYTDAITDCEAAIKLDKKCIKAYVHMGKAFQAQNKFDEAVDIFKMAIKNLPKQGKLIEDYITEAELGKTRYLQEEKAARLIAERADSATEMESAVKLLLLPDQGIMGYLQAIKQIDTLLATDINRTLFRTCNGFKLSHATNNTPISRIWSGSESLKNIDDIEMMCGIMRVLKKACKDNNFNVKEFLSIDHSHAFCRHLTEPADTLVTEAMTSLLHELSITEVGRSLLVAGEDFVKVMEELLKVAARETIVSEVAMSTVNNIALDDGFYTKCKELVETKLFLLVRELLSRLSSKEKPEVTSTTWSLVASGLSAVGNVCRDAHARGRIAVDQSWWRDLCGFMDRYSPSASSDASVCLAVHACLGLLANISSHSPALLQTKVDELMRSITALLPCRDEDILERSLAVLRFILASSENSIKIVRQEKLYVYFITALQSPRKSTTVRYALKCLAVCTQDDEDARQAVLQHGGIESLMGLFASEDEVTVGNAALCLSHCVLLGEVCRKLVATEVVQILLRNATNDKFSVDVRHNAVLCLAKLASGDSRHLDTLKRMNGLEIMHTIFQEKQNS
ncbi:tetratricopeptide repeat protein 12 isoform X2 [Nematostella vectensis]|uniref:tetratricopeptide repeat protein 12 isoform X2 n=1 Tax=Nematostella vectensis TaxID=45351 RepID=UPI002077130C|nr:tetratricopeptide repeat protein 12 isoform X2 [Nematostella vectensis]